jgi:uncharacterized membrane protein YphA (DoxX/SURF4 family)
MSKLKVIGLWALQVILAVPFVPAGLSKVSSNPGLVRMFERMGYPDGFYMVVGVVELAGALGMLIPPVTPYAAGALMCVMAGATYSHLAIGDPVGRAAFTFALFLLLGLVAWARRPAFLRK